MKKTGLFVLTVVYFVLMSNVSFSMDKLNNEEEIARTVKNLKLTKQDCNSRYHTYLYRKISTLHESGKISTDRRLELSRLVTKQVSECRKNKMLHID